MLILAAAAIAITTTTHVRTSDPMLADLLADGLAQSPTIRRLVEAIDASNVIVYLAHGACPRPARACTMMAGGSPDSRYVRIHFTRPDGLGQARAWHRAELSTLLAHELQHATEIAGWPEVVDGPTLEAAYKRRGRDRGGAHLDTDAAVIAGGIRHKEIASRRPR